MRRHRLACLPLCVVIVAPALAFAQIEGAINPAAGYDGRIMASNPAVVAISPAQTYLGLRLNYPGAVANNAFALRTSRFALSLPGVFGAAVGAGVHGRHFNSPLFEEGNLGFMLAQKLGESFALGADLAWSFKSYDRSRFDLEIEDDPVFINGSDKVVFDPGLGLYGRISEAFAIGASAFHLNRPNLALAGKAYRMPVEALAGAIFSHRFLRVDAGLERRREEWRPTFGAEIYSNYFGRIRAGYAASNAILEGQIAVHPNVSFLYSYHLPTGDLGLISAGTHELGLILKLPFGRRAEPNAASPPFYLQAMPPSRVVLQNDTPLYNLNLVRRDSFSESIKLEVSELPPHLKPRMSQWEVNANESIVLALHSNGRLLPGDYTFIVKASGHDYVHHLPLHLRVNPMPKLRPEVFTTVDSIDLIELRLIVEELPLIPRIFFPENETNLSESRYDILNPNQNVFVAEKAREINFVYRNLLNLIGSRLLENPPAIITLTGFSSGPAAEPNWQQVAADRAEAVKSYLVDSLGVPATQIKTEESRKPYPGAPLNNEALREEWQRVEIAAPAPFEDRILGSLLVFKRELEAQPKWCGFVNKYTVAESGIAAWRIIVLNTQGDTVDVLSGRNALPDTVQWQWHHGLLGRETRSGIAQEGASVASLRHDVRLTESAAEEGGAFALWIEDRLAQTAISPWRNFNMRRRTRVLNEIGIERIPIFLFGFGQHNLSRFSPELRRKLHAIAEKLEADPEATCDLKGHTDAIGDAFSNKWLSLQRAKTVHDMLNQLGVSGKRLSYSGLGEEEPLGDNRLPEGRFMNRRVEVYIRHSPQWLDTAKEEQPSTGFDGE